MVLRALQRSSAIPRVCLVGRPSVGKSALLNKLAGRSLALVDKTWGVTRDVREVEGAHLAGRSIVAVDTPGIESQIAASISGRARSVIQESSACLLVTDGRKGTQSGDREWAMFLQEIGQPRMLWVVNKAENEHAVLVDSSSRLIGGLRFPDPIFVSAEHNIGIHSDLAAAMEMLLLPECESDGRHRPLVADGLHQGDDSSAAADRADVPRIVIVGRPNSGKSTLLNTLIGEERMLTGPVPGLTRDSVESRGFFGSREVIVVDTAGLKRSMASRSNFIGDPARLIGMTEAASKRSIDFASVCVVVVDVLEVQASGDFLQSPFRDDCSLISRALKEGRPVVVALNKVDAVRQPSVVERLREHFQRMFHNLQVVALSARNGDGCHALVETAMAVFDAWTRRIPTAKLNRFLESLPVTNPATETLLKNIKYMSQIKVRPPTFSVHAQSKVDADNDPGMRWLTNRLRQEFGLEGVPLRFKVRAKTG